MNMGIVGKSGQTKPRIVGWQGPLIFLVFIATLRNISITTDSQSTRTGIRVIRLKYCGAGYYFRYFEDRMRKILGPTANITDAGSSTPDIIIGSIGDNCERPDGAKRLIIFGENFKEDKIAYFRNLSGISDLILHCNKLIDHSKVKYYPFWVTSFGERRLHSPQNLIKDKILVHQHLRTKRRFCAFMQTHPAPGRDGIFKALSGYKDVDVLGSWDPMVNMKSNKSVKFDRFVYNENVTFYDLSVDKYKPYKFVIAGENGQANGYITEKIISAMLAYAVPIYFGASDIEEHFNSKSFINANKLSKEELLSTVSRLDQNEEEYQKMLMEPWFPHNTLPTWFDDKNFTDIMRPLKIFK